MAETILIQHNVDKDTKIAERELAVPMPACLTAKNLKALVKVIGEEMAFNDINAQLKIKFRAKVRALLASETDGAYTYNDEEILAMDFSDWTPESRVRMSAEEKILKKADGMSPDELKATLAALQGLIETKK